MSNEINIKNYKSHLSPFGNKKRYDDDYLAYLLFENKESMLAYYSVMKDYIHENKPPQLIEMTLAKLSDALSIVRVYKLPYAIILPSYTNSNEELFAKWKTKCIQTVNGKIFGIANNGSNEYDDVVRCIIQIFDWDIFLPANTIDSGTFNQYMVDTESSKFSKVKWWQFWKKTYIICMIY